MIAFYNLSHFSTIYNINHEWTMKVNNIDY